MGYYRAGSYYRAGNVRRAGDYYRGGNIFGDILGGISKVASFIPGVGTIVSAATGALGGLVGGSSRSPVAAAAAAGGIAPRLTAAPRPGHKDEPGVAGVVHRLVPGGRSGYLKSHRTMRVTNVKALNRATRRIKGFEKTAKRSLAVLGLHVTRHVGCKHGKGAR